MLALHQNFESNALHYHYITCNAVHSALHINKHYLLKSHNALQCINTITVFTKTHWSKDRGH
jgi:hypothetical protein